MTFHIVMLVYPDMTQLDLTIPFEVFARLPDARVHLAWKRTKPVTDAAGLVLTPSVKLSRVEACDLLFVPGGPGQLALMEDPEVLAFLRAQAARARYVTALSTGSLLLAAAGLLKGYGATSHWLSLDLLAVMGAHPVAERVVVDRDRITGAGAGCGLDFALRIAALVAGENEAKRISLALEYEAVPPYPRTRIEEPALVEEVRLRTAAFQRLRAEAAQRVGPSLNAEDSP